MAYAAHERARASLLVLVVIALVTVLAGCGSGDEGSGSPPAKTVKQEAAASGETTEATAPEETQAPAEAPSGRTVTVRISGDEGMVYAGNYGNLDGLEYAEGLLEGEPVEFTVDLRESGFDIVNASFAKPDGSRDGALKIEILSKGEVVAEQEAETQYGTLHLTWSSEA